MGPEVRGEKDIVSTVRLTRWITLLPLSCHCPFNSARRVRYQLMGPEVRGERKI